jgi:hypothetical protein
MRSSGENKHQASNDAERAIFRIFDVVKSPEFSSEEMSKTFQNLPEEKK